MDIEILGKKPEMDGKVLNVKVAIADSTRSELVDEALQALAQDAELDSFKDTLYRDLVKRFGAKQVATDVTAHVSAAVAGEVVRRLGLELMFEAERKHQVIETIFKSGAVEQEFDFILQPSFELSSYDPVYVKMAPTKVSEEQVEAYLRSLLEEHARFEKANGLVAEGDFLLVDMTTEVNGKVEDGLSGQRMTLELARGKMPDPFIEGVAGMSVGSTKLFDFRLSDENGTPENFHIDITVRDRRRRTVPELDDAFVKENFADIGSTVEDLRAYARELLEAHAGFQDEQQRELAADAELAKRFTAPIPDFYFERMAKDVYARLKQSLDEQNLTVSQFMEQQGMTERQFQMSVMSQAREALHQGLALDALFAHLDEELEDADIDRALSELAPGREKEAREVFEKNGTWALVTQMAGRLKAHKWLMETAVFEQA